ncbi:uncharacterized protein TNCV_5043191 [Trichonephila clavipes]|nr:uncharacterized protein TNCV_5043191 [Trichonephila clavipes]
MVVAINNLFNVVFYRLQGGCGSLVVKISDCHEFEPSTTKDPRVGKRCTFNLSRAQTSSRWCGGVVRKGDFQIRCRLRHLTLAQNYVVRRQKPSCS